MTWPMHDAGSTTPDPGRDDARGQEPPWPDEPGPDDGEPSRRGRHAAPDPLPPIEGPTPRSSLIRAGAGMAVGTLASRATGFLRTLVLVYAVGIGALGNAYNNSNTLPNTVYYLMLGGIFTSVVVPLLVRAARRDPDRGEAYAQRIFTLGALALLGVTVVATLLAGPLVDLYAGPINGPPGSHLAAQRNLMVGWADSF